VFTTMVLDIIEKGRLEDDVVGRYTSTISSG
jgi:hypothetical protein